MISSKRKILEMSQAAAVEMSLVFEQAADAFKNLDEHSIAFAAHMAAESLEAYSDEIGKRLAAKESQGAASD